MSGGDILSLIVFIFIPQAAHQSGEDEVSLSTFGRAYTIDFNTMQQINEDTGTARSVQRKTNPFANAHQGSGKQGYNYGQSNLHWFIFGSSMGFLLMKFFLCPETT